jgi:hypothetical protein
MVQLVVAFPPVASSCCAGLVFDGCRRHRVSGFSKASLRRRASRPRYHAGHRARRHHYHRHYRHVARIARERGLAQMQARVCRVASQLRFERCPGDTATYSGFGSPNVVTETRRYRYIARASRWQRGVAKMQAQGLADTQASVEIERYPAARGHAG